MSTTDPEQPGRRRRRSRKASEVTSDSEATTSNASESDVPSEADSVSEASSDELEATIPAGEPEAPVTPSPPDAEVEQAAELAESEEAAEEEAEEGEAPAKPARRRRRPGAQAAPAAKKPARPAPARRRRREQPVGPPPEVQAKAKYVRTSPRKARLVCDNIRGKTVPEARAILALTPRAVARDWSKLLESAVANAEHNHELVGEDLYIKAVHADQGPTLKRFRPRAMGRATRIRKRTSHLTILLTPRE